MISNSLFELEYDTDFPVLLLSGKASRGQKFSSLCWLQNIFNFTYKFLPKGFSF